MRGLWGCVLAGIVGYKYSTVAAVSIYFSIYLSLVQQYVG